MTTINKNTDFAIVDFETTGVNFKRDVPIEIAMLLTDVNLTIQAEYSCLIAWPHMRTWIDWNKRQMDAFNVHGITLDRINNKGKTPAVICSELRDVIGRVCQNRPIMISDNPFFDMNMMMILFKANGDVAKTPFHYNPFSTNPLVSMNKSIEHKPKKHRAMSDVHDLYDGLVSAFDHNEFWIG